MPPALFLLAGILLGGSCTAIVIPLGLMLPLLAWIAVGYLHKTPLGMRLGAFLFLWGWAAVSLTLGAGGDFFHDRSSPETDQKRYQERYQGQDQEKYWIKGVAGLSGKTSWLRRTLDLSVTALGRDPQVLIPAKGTLRLSLYGKADAVKISMGDTLFFQGPIHKPRNFKNPGGFDYVRHLALKGIGGRTWAAAGKVIVTPWRGGISWTAFIRKLESLRRFFTLQVATHVENQKAGAVLTALVTGNRNGISRELREVFSRTGTAHLLAVSGMHLAMVGGLFFFLVRWFLLFFPGVAVRGWAGKGAALATLFPLFIYAGLTGFSPATRRAFIMISCLMLAHVAARDEDSLNSLAGAAFIIFFLEPGALFSVSFQLSFTAVLFIIMGLRIPGVAVFFKQPGFFRSIVLFLFVSFCAILGTQPLIMLYFNTISFTGLVTNLFMVPIVGWLVLPMGILSLIFFPVFPLVSIFLIKSGCGVLGFFIPVLEVTAGFPWTWARTVTPHFCDLAGFYIFCAGLWVWFSHKNCRGFIMMGGALLVTGIHEAGVVKNRYWNSSLSAVILDVGQGSSALVELPFGRRVLIDGGGFSGGGDFDTGRCIVAPFLWRRRIMRLDAVILSHPQTDHIRGLVYILENFRVGRFVKNMDCPDLPDYHRLMALVRQMGVPVTIVPETTEWRLPGAFLEFLYPLKGVAPASDPNDNSVVVKVNCPGVSILFSGDIMEKAEKMLAAHHGKRLHSQVLVAPHHGSNTSSSDFFLDQVRPESVIISCGLGNRFGFPHSSVLEKYGERNLSLFRTDLDGAVAVLVDHGCLTIGPAEEK